MKEYKYTYSPVLTDNAESVLNARYYRRDNDGNVIEKFEDLCQRVAEHVGKREDESVKEAFFWMMRSLDFLPNTPTLVNAGTGRGTLSACFVLPVGDTMQGIVKASHDQAMVQKFGGGTGFSVSDIRPKGYPVSTTHGIAMGPVGVLEYLSATSKMVTEGGIRDGANMCVMNVHHPDIMEFIKCKTEEGKLHNFNISVGITHDFMRALNRGDEGGGYAYPLRFREDPSDPDSRIVDVGEGDAKEVWDAIIEGAWRNGEPGAVFLDTINEFHPASSCGEIVATNPCGEQPLLPNESCNLGSINVSNFVMADCQDFDYPRLRQTIHLAVRFLDATIDMNEYATPEIKEANLLTRKIGLGVMGWADALVQMGIGYDSEEALEKADELMSTIQHESYLASERLGLEKGWCAGLDVGESPRRNACTTTIAPTGSISMIAGCSSGIEPIFALAWRKQNILGGETLEYVNDYLVDRVEGEIVERIINGEDLQDMDDVDEDTKRVFVTSPNISPGWHVMMQGAFQRNVDSGVSKTINLPNSATIEDVEDAYRGAYSGYCKGITVYRAGSREKEVLVKNEALVKETDIASVKTDAEKNEYHGRTIRYATGRGKVYITLNRKNDGGLQEVFITHGKAGGNDAAMAEALSRLISVSLQEGVAPIRIVKQLKDITDTPVWSNGVNVKSLPDAVAIAMLDEMRRQERLENEVVYTDRATGKEYVEERYPPDMMDDCNECGFATLVYEEGCNKCLTCGFSSC